MTNGGLTPRSHMTPRSHKPDDYILAIVEIDGDTATPRYIRRPFQREPDFGVTSVNYDLGQLLQRAEEPR